MIGGSKIGLALITFIFFNFTNASLSSAAGFQGLGYLPGGSCSEATAVSADGSVVVGGLDNQETALFEAYRWTAATGTALLGTCLPDFHSRALGVSGNGSIIVGYVQNNAGFDEQKAFIWDQDHGMRLLQDVLEDDFGLDLSAWKLTEDWASWKATGISQDGSIIVGTALNAEGRQEAWRAVLGRIVYVDRDATGANNGSSWADAYNYLQDALMFAAAGDEIRVAEGIYKPDDFVLSDRPNREREETFRLINDVTIKGGYAGFGQPDPDARDVNDFETILSGDRLNNDAIVTDPADLLSDATRQDNCYHVVTGHDTDATAVLDGCTITGGNANWGYWVAWYGGGITADSAAFTLTNCKIQGNVAAQGGGLHIGSGGANLIGCTFTGNAAFHAGGMINGGRQTTVADCAFTDNYADTSGGGFYNTTGSHPTFMRCIFSGNSATQGGGAIGSYNNYGFGPVLVGCIFSDKAAPNGGGYYNDDGDPILTDCRFSRNQAEQEGGGFYNLTGKPTLESCLFVENRSDQDGGGMQNDDGSPNLTACVFRNNFAEDEGGGMCNEDDKAPPLNPVLVNCIFAANVANGHGGAICNDRSNPTLTNCTFSGNTAESGGGMYGENGSTATLSNCILRSDAPDELHNNNAATTVLFSDVQGGWEGKGNIDADPRFADPNSGDYHLKSQAGRWDPNEERWTIDEVASPCVDGGNPMSPIGYEPFPNGGIVNMGAYGGTAGASKSYFGKPPCETIVAGDVNGDCAIDFRDFCIMALHWCEDNSI